MANHYAQGRQVYKFVELIERIKRIYGTREIKSVVHRLLLDQRHGFLHSLQESHPETLKELETILQTDDEDGAFEPAEESLTDE